RVERQRAAALKTAEPGGVEGEVAITAQAPQPLAVLLAQVQRLASRIEREAAEGRPAIGRERDPDARLSAEIERCLAVQRDEVDLAGGVAAEPRAQHEQYTAIHREVEGTGYAHGQDVGGRLGARRRPHHSDAESGERDAEHEQEGLHHDMPPPRLLY